MHSFIRGVAELSMLLGTSEDDEEVDVDSQEAEGDDP